MSQPDAWAGYLELQACAKTLTLCLLVLHEDAAGVLLDTREEPNHQIPLGVPVKV